jgi:starch phosphorylase
MSETSTPGPGRLQLKHHYLGLDPASLKQSLANHLAYTVAKDPLTATERDWFTVTAHTLRDRLIERWMETTRTYYRRDAKQVYYLSMEFLLGRALTNSALNMGVHDECCQVLGELGLSLEAIRETESDAALGNGGLGRLAACLLDSMATLRLPGYGYGIRYEYGMFNQHIRDGWQVEHPENWLRCGNPWEFPRPEVLYPVQFGGRVVEYTDGAGRFTSRWVDAETVMAMAYDTPIPGFGTNTVNNLRLWTAKSSRELDLRYFNEGDYIQAVADKNSSENISRVLYPNDATICGRELRLKQEYFFVAATVQDILRRYLSAHADLRGLPEKVAIHLNDTHPALAIAELMRLLLDQHHLDWAAAWEITVATFSYTNHTLLPEALETWPAPMLERLLPRHLAIIHEINRRFLEQVRHRHPGDMERLRRVSLVAEGDPKRVRMAHLAIVGSHAVNGVAELHSRLLRERVFADFEELYPGRITNITNGITQRRWINQANPALAQVLNAYIGRGWVSDLEQLGELEALADDHAFQAAFAAAKHSNKQRLAGLIRQHLGQEVDPESLFDVQVKRIHEYKRQLLNVLQIITRYNRIRRHPGTGWVSRTVIIAGKAAPGYRLAKLIIKLVNDVADVVNNDPAVSDRLRVVFIPNYDVTTAADIIPAADLSEQISTAGTEASGTGNMKLALNGAVTLGTLDGANIEIRAAVGAENFIEFGLDVERAAALAGGGYDPSALAAADGELLEVLEMIGGGYFSPGEPKRFRPLLARLLEEGDTYLVLADFRAYLEAQERADVEFRQAQRWNRMAILNVARMGRFSSDRTVREYAERIWGVAPAPHD